MSIEVASPNVKYVGDDIITSYNYQSTVVDKDPKTGKITVTPTDMPLMFRTKRTPKKTGVMMVGWGGNNGSTVTASILANKAKMTWETKKGVQAANFFGSITQSSTIRVGTTKDFEEVYAPLKDMIPMVDPANLALGGWDCSSMNLGDAMKRAQVLEPELQRQLRPAMEKLKPLPAIFDLEFVADNQDERADNILAMTKKEATEVVRKNIRDFKAANGLDQVIVLWTANTERFTELMEGTHDTADNMLAALARNEAELAPSACYCIAAILEGCPYINGAPQNTFVPGLVELAERHNVFIAGDDFKSGQTKMKSALIEFFVGAGIKPECIASYNHLGNNDGRNLASPRQFRSKEITKSNVVDDMVASNKILFPDGTKKPDHCIVIKYLPHVGDSKRAMDEYIFQIFMGGQQSVVMHNTCEDSLLAAPLILDLTILTELMGRIEVSTDGGKTFETTRNVLSILSYLLKAPFVPKGTPVINALNRQKQCIENLLRALVGLPPENNLLLECKLKQTAAVIGSAAAAAPPA